MNKKKPYTTVIIKIDNKTDFDLIEKIKKITDEKTTSKTFLKCFREYEELTNFKKRILKSGIFKAL